MPQPLTIGEVACRFGVRTWKVRRLYESGFLPEPARLGVYRVFFPEDLPEIEKALREHGYLPAEAVGAP